MDKELQKMWEKYEKGEITRTEFLLWLQKEKGAKIAPTVKEVGDTN